MICKIKRTSKQGQAVFLGQFVGYIHHCNHAPAGVQAEAVRGACEQLHKKNPSNPQNNSTGCETAKRVAKGIRILNILYQLTMGEVVIQELAQLSGTQVSSLTADT